MAERIEIQVAKRATDYWTDYTANHPVRMPKFHAQIADNPGYWGEGKTIDEAIGSLIRSHPNRFNLTITEVREPR